MTRETLLALAERVEAAEGPDRELDWLIADALGEVPAHSIRTIGFDYDWYRKPDERTLWRAKDSEGRSVETWTPKNRTAFLDAAMTLIPAQYRLGTLIEFDGEGRWAAKLFNRGKPGGLPAAGGSLAALALVVTCLRARAGDGV